MNDAQEMTVQADPFSVTAATLASIDVFRDVPYALRTQIARPLRARRCARKAVIIRRQDTCTEVFFIVSGVIRVTYYSWAGREVLFRDLVAGQLCGELAALDGTVRSADAWVFKDAIIIPVAQTAFHELLAAHPMVARGVMRHLAATVRDLTARVVELSTLGIAMRVRMEVLRLAEQSGPTSTIAITHEELAKRIGTTRVAVTREIGELIRTGVLERPQRKGGSLKISSIAGLRGLLDGGDSTIAGENPRWH
jgi:CRP/FNR family transcriptional regulator, cyclic AMP receptor protein